MREKNSMKKFPQPSKIYKNITLRKFDTQVIVTVEFRNIKFNSSHIPFWSLKSRLQTNLFLDLNWNTSDNICNTYFWWSISKWTKPAAKLVCSRDYKNLFVFLTLCQIVFCWYKIMFISVQKTFLSKRRNGRDLFIKQFSIQKPQICSYFGRFIYHTWQNLNTFFCHFFSFHFICNV